MAKKEFFKIFLDADDMCKLHANSKTWCYERLKEIALYFNLLPHQRVSIFHFCAYEGIFLDDMILLLKKVGIIPEV
jgi:hypothetical protein